MSRRVTSFEVNLADYKRVSYDQIGSGSYGSVYKVQYIKTGEIRAYKVLKEQTNVDADKIREINIMAQLNHPTFIQFFGYSPIDFAKNQRLTIFMEYAENKSLYHYIFEQPDDQSKQDNTKIQIILIGIARGMMLLHQKNIIHRDLSSMNIVLDQLFRPKITDFGLSKFINKNSQKNTIIPSTIPYEAPEKIDSGNYNHKIDVYSFAIILYEVITKQAPYPKDFTYQIPEYVKSNKRPKFPANVPLRFKTLIEKCWDHSQENRPEFKEIYQLLAFDPDYYLIGVDVHKVFDYINLIDPDYNRDKMINLLSSRLKIVEVNNHLMKNDLEKIKDESAQIKNSNTVFETKNKELEIKNKDLETQNKDLKNKSDEYEIQNKKFTDNIINLKQQNDILIKEVTSLKEEIKKLKENKKNDTTASNTAEKDVKMITQSLSNSQDSMRIHNRFKNMITERSKSQSSINVTDFNDNSLSILKFNKLSGIEQLKYFRKQDQKSMHSDQINRYITFLNHLEKSSPNVEKNFIEIQADVKDRPISFLDEKCSFLNSIYISSTASEILYNESNLNEAFLKNSDLHLFDEIVYEFEYPSEPIFDQILILKQNNTKVKISMYLSQISNIEYEPIKNNIDYIKFGITFSINSKFNPFGEFTQLKKVFFSDKIDNIDHIDLQNSKSLEKIILPVLLKDIPENLLLNCINLIEIVFPKSLTEIKMCAFKNCSSIVKIDLPDSVKNIGNEAFSECKSLKEITIPSKIKVIRKSLFYNCISLTEITIPRSVQIIEEKAFCGCSSLEKLDIPISVNKIGNDSLNCPNLKKLKLRREYNNYNCFGIPKDTILPENNNNRI